MTDSVPARAPGGPPEIGQSTTVTPCAAAACSISFTNGTPTVQVLTSSFIALPGDKAVSAEHDRAERRQCGQRDEDNLALVCEFPGRGGASRLTIQQGLHRRFANVVHRQAMSAVQQPGRHGQSHVADTKESLLPPSTSLPLAADRIG